MDILKSMAACSSVQYVLEEMRSTGGTVEMHLSLIIVTRVQFQLHAVIWL